MAKTKSRLGSAITALVLAVVSTTALAAPAHAGEALYKTDDAYITGTAKRTAVPLARRQPLQSEPADRVQHPIAACRVLLQQRLLAQLGQHCPHRTAAQDVGQVVVEAAACRRNGIERVDDVHHLALDPQRLAARRDHAHRREPGRQGRAARQHVLAGVEGQHRLVHVEPLHLCVVGERGQADPPHVVPAQEFHCGLGLADSWWSDERDQ
ncbi:hypothetical protein [Lentzea sp. NPDC051838]|uniref:hypothetical protein n=1 Tax=Lentzea sp. NPDC051838 TaxID=3154849 RepID=UPI00341D0F17